MATQTPSCAVSCEEGTRRPRDGRPARDCEPPVEARAARGHACTNMPTHHGAVSDVLAKCEPTGLRPGPSSPSASERELATMPMSLLGGADAETKVRIRTTFPCSRVTASMRAAPSLRAGAARPRPLFADEFDEPAHSLAVVERPLQGGQARLQRRQATDPGTCCRASRAAAPVPAEPPFERTTRITPRRACRRRASRGSGLPGIRAARARARRLRSSR